MPFDDTTLVYKIGGRMYAYAGIDDFHRFAVKCDPDEAVELRERHAEISPAHHSSKKHWNDLSVQGLLPDSFLREQIRKSYLLVLEHNVTPRSLRDQIKEHIDRTGLPG